MKIAIQQRCRIFGVLLLALVVLALGLSRLGTSTQTAIAEKRVHSTHASKASPLTAGTVTEYAIPTNKSQPVGITTGPDGNLWFTEGHGNKIGKVTSGGVFTEYALPTAMSEPEGITSGPCGDGLQEQCLWFTEYKFSSQDIANIGRITTDGTITEYPLLTKYARANDITLGPGGVLYFTEQINNSGDISPESAAKIGQITTSGQVQLSELASLPNGGCLPNSIALGSDGNLWFTEYYQIGTIMPTGTVTEYQLPPLSNGNLPDHITAGPDGNLWFTEYTGGNIGKITTQ